MYVQDVDDVAYCRYFPKTLKGVSQKWFSDLSSGSITFFYDLREWFISQFIASRRGRRMSNLLSKIEQGNLEITCGLYKAIPSGGNIDLEFGGWFGIHNFFERSQE